MAQQPAGRADRWGQGWLRLRVTLQRCRVVGSRCKQEEQHAAANGASQGSCRKEDVQGCWFLSIFEVVCQHAGNA